MKQNESKRQGEQLQNMFGPKGVSNAPTNAQPNIPSTINNNLQGLGAPTTPWGIQTSAKAPTPASMVSNTNMQHPSLPYGGQLVMPGTMNTNTHVPVGAVPPGMVPGMNPVAGPGSGS